MKRPFAALSLALGLTLTPDLTGAGTVQAFLVPPAPQELDGAARRARLRDFATASLQTYAPAAPIVFGGAQHGVFHRYSNDCVRAYVRDFHDRRSVVIAFKGTNPQDMGDLLRDLQGSAMLTPGSLRNPLTGGTISGAQAGLGFDERARNYLKTFGRLLLDDIVELRDQGKAVEISMTGHSLGGVASQLASLFLSQALRAKFGSNSGVILHNVSFNTPHAGNPALEGAYRQEIALESLNALTVVRAGDVISEVKLGLRRNLLVEPVPNDALGKRAVVLPPRVKSGLSLDNHRLDLVVDDLMGHLSHELPTFRSYLHASAQTDDCEFYAVCGDGLLTSGESCDDGNRLSGDACNAACRLEQSHSKNQAHPCAFCSEGN